MASFTGIAMIDTDPYLDGGANWYTNQNNFFRQVRNFILDLTALDMSTGAGIHWQVAQATSLQNIVFNMVTGGGSANKQQGIFMDNGSGGFMSDLTFNGGNYGAFVGNQQFTTRNLVFNGCNTGMFMNWNWAWTLKSATFNNCGVGLNMSTGGDVQTVGSVLLVDSVFKSTPIGVVTSYDTSSSASNGTLIVDNVDFSGTTTAIQGINGDTILSSSAVVKSWVQGHAYQPTSASASTTSSNGTTARDTTYVALARAASSTCAASASPVASSKVQTTQTGVTKPAALLDGSGNVFERSKPQYENLTASAFVSVKSAGAKGDGVTDDTAVIQKVLDAATSDQVVYFDHGAYLITSTVKVPANIRITGEIWPLIMASGDFFSDMTNPKPVFQIGQPGDVGSFEISDIIFETKGPAPGAIMMEWNIAEDSQGSAAMWDTHFRIGGSAGTELQSDTCVKTPNSTTTPDASCEGAFLLFHLTSEATAYVENSWFWVADHELDLADHSQINIYNGRGVLIESTKAAWLYGTSAEHSTLYNYQVANASNVYMSLIQTETPYFQANPNALVPFTPNTAYSDPTFADCTTDSCKKSWGLRVVDSSSVFVYGAGLYSFFDNYDQTCLDTESCQENMVAIDCSDDVYLYGLSTKAAVNMVTVNGESEALGADNMDNFCQTLALFEQL